MPAPVVAIVTLVLLSAAEVPPPPPKLACLARHYPIRPELHNGAWFARLSSGARIPFDDGLTKTFDERLEAPDLKDLFFVRYRRGPVEAVETEDYDPGRARVLGLLTATYGSRPSEEQVRTKFLGIPVRVHRKIAPHLEQVASRLAEARARDASLRPFLRRLSGGFADRNIAGTDRRSAHAFGIAIDLDKSMSDYWRWQRKGPHRWHNRIPQPIVDAFEAEGFIWGGRWYHYDTMHFEFRPEMLDPTCSE
jgi:hypothetical protein